MRKRRRWSRPNPVKEAAVVSLHVNNAEETKHIIETFLASGAGIESATRHEEVARKLNDESKAKRKKSPGEPPEATGQQ